MAAVLRHKVWDGLLPSARQLKPLFIIWVTASNVSFRKLRPCLDSYVSIMTNFMYQLDWATGCPALWSNIILGVLVRVFLNEIHI